MKSVTIVSTIAVLGACLPAAPNIQPASATSIQQQQRDAIARSSGFPTKKSPQELDAAIARQTRGYSVDVAGRAEGKLEAPRPYTIHGVKDTCYAVVLRLGDRASWGIGAEAGLKLDFQSPTGAGSGGPGLIGPGAVTSVGCAEADGPITLTMAPLVGNDPIGSGPFAIGLWSRAMSATEAAKLHADKAQQIKEQREYKAEKQQREREQATEGCARCNRRYETCLDISRPQASCYADFRSCAFDRVGPGYLSVCPNPS